MRLRRPVARPRPTGAWGAKRKASRRRWSTIRKAKDRMGSFSLNDKDDNNLTSGQAVAWGSREHEGSAESALALPCPNGAGSSGRSHTRTATSESPKRDRAFRLERASTSAHSITSSARASNACGTVTPSARAVIRLTIRSNLVGCSTGRSAGFAPRRILSTRSAARRFKSG